MPHIIVGTAGHIDHGKTALVKALTGVDTDRLKEEKTRGITIDIGFASLALDADTTLGFVDVPGHERFVRNMLAGVGGIDVVMLVVAADESVMPQTREHLDICSLLHIRRGIIVLTKIDAADPELAELSALEVHELVRGTFLEHAPVVRVSARTGEGLPHLVETLRATARQIVPRDATRIFRLPIDRAFTMKGFGTVVSGTLIAGRVRRDEEIAIVPGGRTARVRGVQVHGAPVDEACAGQRTALNVPKLEVRELERGMVAVPPDIFSPTTLLDVELELLPAAPAPVLRRKRVRFHVGTAERMGYVTLLGQDRLEPGARAVARIRLDTPVFALPGDRFIVRQYSPMTTIGGGEILDAAPRRRRRLKSGAREWLERLARASEPERILAAIDASPGQAASVPDLVGRLGLQPAQITAHLQAHAHAGHVVTVGDNPLVAVMAGTFARMTSAIVEEVTAFHARERLLPGMPREELKARVARDVPPAVFRAGLEHLVTSRRVALDQEVVQLFDRAVTLADDERRIRDLLVERYGSLGLQAPGIDEVIAGLDLDRRKARPIVQLLLKERSLVKIAAEVAVDARALDALVDGVRALKARTPTLGVKEFKELTGLSRKFAVPLLEYLDTQRVTRRRGDEREIL
jgi:selenocysteine-specific elongation factor